MEFEFKNTFMGYDKNRVTAYIEELTADMMKTIGERDAQIEELKKQVKTLSDENVSLSGTIKKYETDKGYIADAIIKAEEKAKKMVEEAETVKRQRISEFESKIVAEKDKLSSAKADLAALCWNAVNVVRRFEEELKNLEESGGAVKEKVS